MVILYIYSTCWCMKSTFYEHQQLVPSDLQGMSVVLVVTEIAHILGVL
jgi:hypothetical protein